MVNADVAACYATLVDPWGSTAGRPSAHRGADYRRSAGQPILAYEECTVVDSDLKSQYLGYSLVARRKRDGKYIGWAHIRQGTRPANGTVLLSGGSVGLVAGFDDFHGSSWDGPHIHTTEGDTADHIYQGKTYNPAGAIANAIGSTAGGGSSGVNYHWYDLSADAMGALQEMTKAAGLYGGPVDKDFGEKSVKAVQEILKRWGYLAGDYEVDGIPHNPDVNSPSNYGFGLQRFAKAEAGYDGLEDGLPAGYTSQFLVTAANKKRDQLLGTPTTPTTPPIKPPVVVPPAETLIPDFPMVSEGFVFFPDLGSSQGDFDFTEYNTKGGRHVFLKMGGGNASDSPYIAPRWKDQVTRARAANQKIGHYWFNGSKNGLTPESSADYFALHTDLREGEIVAIDIEDETATNTVHWSPSEAVRFIRQLRTHFPAINGLVYMSDSVADSDNWTEVKNLGWELWSASWGANDGNPGMPPTSDEYTTFTAWQYTSEELVPGNYSGNPKVYRRTDGNMTSKNTWNRLGWKTPIVVPKPEPEPEPVDDLTKKVMKNYLEDTAKLAASYATKLV